MQFGQNQNSARGWHDTGSGLGPMAETIEDAVIIPTDQIPNCRFLLW